MRECVFIRSLFMRGMELVSVKSVGLVMTMVIRRNGIAHHEQYSKAKEITVRESLHVRHFRALPPDHDKMICAFLFQRGKARVPVSYTVRIIPLS